MKLIYTTLINNDEARKICRELLKEKLANCVNFFPITCIYNYKDKITEEPEVVLIIKTKTGKYNQIKQMIKANIDYDNFIGQLNVDKINSDFSSWLTAVVK
mgnify:CR=1 FL=1